MERTRKWGRPRKIESPEILWDLAMLYFDWVDQNPWVKNELIKSGDLAGQIIPVPASRPYTWGGLEIFCFEQGYNTRLDEYRFNRHGAYKDFSDVTKKIEQIVRTQKFEGASIGAFNANIISADLGLAQRTISEVKTHEDFDYDDLSEAALEEIVRAKAKKQANED